MSVSYTHLDVYKRQPLLRLVGDMGPTDLFASALSESILDVDGEPTLGDAIFCVLDTAALLLLTADTLRTPSRAASCIAVAARDPTPAGCRIVYCFADAVSGEETDMVLVLVGPFTFSCLSTSSSIFVGGFNGSKQTAGFSSINGDIGLPLFV